MEQQQELAREVQRLKGAVEALEAASAPKGSGRFWNFTTVMSIVAFFFSLGTTAISYYHTHMQDIQNRRGELRTMLQRLAALPKDNFEITRKYADDPAAVSALSGYINQENSMLARQAAEVSSRLPRDQVSATEYYAIGLALQNSYNLDRGMEFIQKAITASRDFNDEISALRTYANQLFLAGQPEAGRVQFQKALGIFSRYRNYNDYTQKSTNIWTELSWALSEANSNYQDEARQHVDSAYRYLATLPPSPGKQQLENQIAQAQGMLMRPQIPQVPRPAPPVNGLPQILLK